MAADKMRAAPLIGDSISRTTLALTLPTSVTMAPRLTPAAFPHERAHLRQWRAGTMKSEPATARCKSRVARSRLSASAFGRTGRARHITGDFASQPPFSARARATSSPRRRVIFESARPEDEDGGWRMEDGKSGTFFWRF
jgi:hypothetical protein